MKPTRPAWLAACFVALGFITWLVVREAYDSVTIPSGPVVTVLVIAVFEVIVAWTTRNRLRGRQLAKPIHPLAVARLAALAKASSLLGSAVAGAWAGVLAHLLTLNGGSASVSDDRELAIAGIVSGVLLVAAALWLEWICRVPKPPQDETSSTGHAARP